MSEGTRNSETQLNGSPESIAELVAQGVYVVCERQTYKTDVVGVTLTLDDARKLVVDAAGFIVYDLDTSDPEEPLITGSHVADPDSEEAMKLFRWTDENQLWPSQRFAPGVGKLGAVWQDEFTSFHVEWHRVYRPMPKREAVKK